MKDVEDCGNYTFLKADTVAILMAHDEFKGSKFAEGQVVMDFAFILKD